MSVADCKIGQLRKALIIGVHLTMHLIHGHVTTTYNIMYGARTLNEVTQYSFHWGSSKTVATFHMIRFNTPLALLGTVSLTTPTIVGRDKA